MKTHPHVVVAAAVLLTIFGTVSASLADPLRRWTDDTGQFHMRAEFVSLVDGRATFKKENGIVITVPLKRLSAGDAQLAMHYNEPAKRKALQKFVDIGYVSCDDDGAIHLGLSQSGCTDNDLKLAADLPEVASIGLFECGITDEGLAPLAGLKQLRLLHLDETDVKGPGFQYLAGLENLEEFQYSPYNADEPLTKHLEHLAGLKNLKTLTLRFSKVGAAGLEPIGKLTNLQSLELLDCEIKSPALQRLAGLTKLKKLHINSQGIDDAECAHLAGMKELETLEISGGRITRTGMQHIGSLKQLKRLDLLLEVSNEDLAPLAELSKLRWLRLSHKGITDEGLAHVSKLTELEELHLPENITADGLPHLANLKKLQHLEFQGEDITFSQAMSLLVDRQGREVIDAMQVLLPSYSGEKDKKLTWLSLDFRPKADRETLKYLAGLPDLTGINLGEETTDEWLVDIGKLTKLESIQFRGNRFNDHPIVLSGNGTKHLAACQHLKSIEFHDCNLGPGAITSLGAPPKLEHLTLDECTLTGDDAAALGKMTSLKQLNIRDTNFRDDNMQHLAPLGNLEYLSLPDEVTLKGLAAIKDLRKLRSLQMNWRAYKYADVMATLTGPLGRSKLDALAMFMNVNRNEDGKAISLRWAYDMEAADADLVILKELPDLESLTLPDNLSDVGLAHVASLTKLKSLNINSENVTDAGLEHLARLTNLESFYISNAPITDSGLKHLAGLKKLKDVDLHRSKVTEAGAAELQTALPEASIRH